MAQAQARTQEDESTEASESFANRTKGPALTLKAGHGVVIKNWKNSGQNGDFFNTAIEQSYKPEGGDWVTNKINLTEDTLPAAICAMQEAYRAILLERSQQQGRAR